MKRILPVLFAVFSVYGSAAFAQMAFGIEPLCAGNDEAASVSMPLSTFKEMMKSNTLGATDKDACLTADLSGPIAGWQTDFDGDGKEELWMHVHSGDPLSGCNVLAVASSIGAGKYQLLEMVPLPSGKVSIRPIRVLATGMQMFVQNAYALPDGTPEVRGSIMTYTQTSILPLLSWVQKDMPFEGKPMPTDVRVTVGDMNFDKVKEISLLVTTWKKKPGPKGKEIEKNILDRYILAFDYDPQRLAYGLYDSLSFDKVKAANADLKKGQRLMARAETSADGIVLVRDALRKNPFQTEARVKLGKYFLTTGRYADAERTLLVAKETDPGFSTTYMVLADTYLRMNNLQGALEAYTIYLKLNPTSKEKKRIEHNIKQITIPKGRRP